MSQWIVPLAVVVILGAGLWSGVKVFDVFVEGAAQGLKTGVTILPALVALLTAVGMFKASGSPSPWSPWPGCWPFPGR